MVTPTPDPFVYICIAGVTFTLVCGFGSTYYSFCVVHPEMRRKRREKNKAILTKILDGWEYIDGKKWGQFYGVPKTEEEWNNVSAIYKDQFPDMRRRMEQKEAKEAKKQKTKQRKATGRSRSRSGNRNSSAGGKSKGNSASKSRNRSSSPGSKKRL